MPSMDMIKSLELHHENLQQEKGWCMHVSNMVLSMVAKCQMQTEKHHLFDEIEHKSAKDKKQVGCAEAIL